MATRSSTRKPRREAVPAAEPAVAAIVAAPAVPKPAPFEASAPAIAQLLTFFASGYEYAASILNVREIAEYRPLTPVPGTPPWIRGVMNLRGTVVPVIDLASKLGLAQTEVTRRTCLLIVDVNINGEPAVVAVMVDAVSRVIDLAPADLQEVPSFGPRVDTSFLLGMARFDGRLVLLLDMNHVVESADVDAAATMMSAIGEQLPQARPECA